MAFGFKQCSYDAVLFVDNNKVIKEMLLSEFEAVLDGIVGEPDYAGETCQAVYLKIDTSLAILGAVFFAIDFDAEGAADKRWNLPLSQLVETAAFGAELNGTPVRVACRSQCQIPWHQSSLWEPDLSATSNIFKVLDAHIKQNKLGLVVEKSKPNSVPAADPSTQDSGSDQTAVQHQEISVSEDELRVQMARNMKKLRLHINNLKTRHQQELDALRGELASEKESLTEQIDALSKDKQEVLDKSSELSIEIEQLNALLSEQKLDYEKQLNDTLSRQGVDLEEIRKQFRRDLQQKLIEKSSELNDKLEMREMELHYRQDQIEQLSTELEELKSEIANGLQQQSPAGFEQLANAGVHFVVTLPGLGPLNIPVSELNSYLAAKDTYLANRLKIDKQTYLSWLAYAQHPVCAAVDAGQSPCEIPVELVLPHDFIPGVSDHCSLHRCASANVVNG